MRKFDLHMHSKYSRDGILDPETIVKIALKRGLDGLAVTDHDTIRGGLAAKKVAPKGLEVICGCEVSTDRGDVIGLFLSEEIRSRCHIDVIEEIRSQGGVAIVPHPFDSMRGSAFWLREDDSRKIDGVEVMNARCIFRRSNNAAVDYADRYSLAKVGGSDAHFGAEIGNAGTLIPEDSDVRESILKNRTMAYGNISSPFFNFRTTALLMRRRIYKTRKDS
ncbi:metal-dependent phosphoesterase [Methanocella sp. CWC-04]|uniref:Metal-dependent phosphoesterase n=1 Tax=Methanooceanicella nereidis TaxID=2052831 RepID=A0AAP2W795_9EURY|nr:PHP domain-containing protein [Methanocella sp. CWC-04]MCD1296172.1 metal-dependent phosphoesterase [Methanocella sp. CWC-04]